MRLFSVIFAITLGLSGCVSNPYQGNFSSLTSQKNSQVIIEDAVLQVATIYIPAQTQFHISKPNDTFGEALISRLRQAGFAINESSNVQEPNDLQEPQYILDEVDGLQLQRLTLVINGQKLTRAYQPSHGELKPAGAWLRQEILDE